MDGLESNRMEQIDGMEWNEMESNGMEQNGWMDGYMVPRLIQET